MDVIEALKFAGAIAGILLVLELYDLLVPMSLRQFPCAICNEPTHGCQETCGSFRRYERIKRNKAAVAGWVASLRALLQR